MLLYMRISLRLSKLVMCTVERSILDTLGPERSVLITEVSLFQGLKM